MLYIPSSVLWIVYVRLFVCLFVCVVLCLPLYLYIQTTAKPRYIDGRGEKKEYRKRQREKNVLLSECVYIYCLQLTHETIFCGEAIAPYCMPIGIGFCILRLLQLKHGMIAMDRRSRQTHVSVGKQNSYI